MKIIRESEVKRPSTTPLGSSVLDHVGIDPSTMFGLRNADAVWPTLSELDPFVEIDFDCTPGVALPASDPLPSQIFTEDDWTPSFEFIQRAAIQAHPIGLDRDWFSSEVDRILDYREGQVVERAIMETRLVADPGGRWGAATKAHGATNPSATMALAMMESLIATEYGESGMIHMPRAILSLLSDRVVKQGDKFYTVLGTPIAAGGGYDEQGSETQTMFISGPIHVEATERTSDTRDSAGSISARGASYEGSLADNSVLAVGMRMFRVTVEGPIYYANVEVK